MKSYLSKYRDIIIVIAIIFLCLIFSRHFLSFTKDILAGSYPLPDGVDILTGHFFTVDCLKQGFLSYWNPYILCGIPSLAEPHNAVFYPLNLIFLLLPINIAYNYSIVLHLMLASVFMYFFAREININPFSGFCSAVIFIFSSIFSLHIFVGHLNNIYTMAWLPVLFFLSEKLIKTKNRTYAILGGIALGAQILSGHMQYVFYSMLAIAFYLTFRFIANAREKTIILKNGLFIFLIGLLLSCVQLLPTLEFVRYSTRSIKTLDFISMFSFVPENFITLIIPEFFGNSLNNISSYWGRWYFWEMCIYIGILPLVMAITSLRLIKKNKHVLFFSLLTLISLIFATGHYMPILKNILLYLPVFNMLRGHAKFIFLTAFSLSILTGFGLDYLFNSTTKELKTYKRRLIYINIFIVTLSIPCLIKSNLFIEGWKPILTFLFSLGERFWIYDYTNPSFIKESFRLACSGLLRFLILFILSTLAILLINIKRIKLNIIKFLILLLIIADLLSFSGKFVKSFNLKDILWNEKVIKVLKEDDYSRIAIRDLLSLNLGIRYKIPSLGGCSAIFLQDYADYIKASQDLYDYQNVVFFFNSSKLLDFIGLKYLLTASDSQFKDNNLSLVFSDEKINIYTNANPYPRAFMVFDTKIIKNKEDIAKELQSRNYDPKEYIILEEDINNVLLKDLRKNKYNVQITKYLPNEVTIEVETEGDGFLFLSDTYYPNWKVLIDGKIAMIYRANLAFRAVHVKQGKHNVKFYFSSVVFKLGLAISLTTLIFILGVFINLFLHSKFFGKKRT